MNYIYKIYIYNIILYYNLLLYILINITKYLVTYNRKCICIFHLISVHCSLIKHLTIDRVKKVNSIL